MAKHRKFDKRGQNRVEIVCVGNLIGAIRRDGPTGVWQMAKGIWASELRRAAR